MKSLLVKILLTIVLAIPVLGLIIYCAISGFIVAWHVMGIVGPIVFGILMVVFVIGLLIKVFMPSKKRR